MGLLLPRVFVLFMKTTSSTQPAPTASRTTRGVTHTKSYGPFLRIADCVAGWRDRGHLEANTESDGAIVMPYALRLQATFDENDRGALARLQDTCRQPATRLRELITDLERLTVQMSDAQSALNQMPSVPTADELTVRNGGELHFDAQAVAVRRGRDHSARLAQANARLTKLADERNRHQVECARHAARLVEEFELARSISERLRQYYNRRLASYARHARIPGSAMPTTDAPAWTLRPCPWLPAGGDAAADPAASISRESV
jgi:hypothetical protein